MLNKKSQSNIAKEIKQEQYKYITDLIIYYAYNLREKCEMNIIFKSCIDFKSIFIKNDKIDEN